MIYELRRYQLFPHNKKAFHERFGNHAMRIMDKYGFKVIGAWDTEIGEGPTFTYILAWEDLNTRQAAWDKFNTDQEWTQIKKDTHQVHGQLVARTHSEIMKAAGYSPLR